MQSSLVRLHLARGARARSPLAALAALLAVAGLSSGCSLGECQQMKSDGSAFAGVFCGGSGDDAPEAADAGPTACSDISQVMPQFFELLDAGQLTGIQEAVTQIGQPTCADEPPPAACNSDTVCPVGVCDSTNHCPCQNSFSPLGDLLESTFHALAIISNPSNPGEPGAVPPSKCVDAAAAEALQPGQRNTLCEIRRTIDFLVNQDGGDKLFNDPNVNAVLVALLNYIQGDYTPPAGTTATPHYDLFTTFGLIAQNPGVCDPQIIYDLLDKVLVYLTPAIGATSGTPSLRRLHPGLAATEICSLWSEFHPTRAARARDLTTPSGRLLVQLLGALAEFERELIRERVKAGLARVKATGRTRSGKPIGRPRREVNGAKVAALRAEGRSWRAIAQALKVPRRTVERAI